MGVVSGQGPGSGALPEGEQETGTQAIAEQSDWGLRRVAQHAHVQTAAACQLLMNHQGCKGIFEEV